MLNGCVQMILLVQLGLLGNVEVLEDARRLAIRGGKQRALFAMLLLNANQIVLGCASVRECPLTPMCPQTPRRASP